MPLPTDCDCSVTHERLIDHMSTGSGSRRLVLQMSGTGHQPQSQGVKSHGHTVQATTVYALKPQPGETQKLYNVGQKNIMLQNIPQVVKIKSF